MGVYAGTPAYSAPEQLRRDFLDRLPNEAVQGPSRDDWGSTDAATAQYWGQRTAAFHGITTWSPTANWPDSWVSPPTTSLS